MISELIYSQLYEYERLLYTDKRVLLTVHNSNVASEATPEEFIEVAKRISIDNRISVNIFDREDSIRVDFYMTGKTILEEGSYYWDYMQNHSNMYSYTLPNRYPETLLVSFVHIKKEKLSKNP